MGYHLHWPPGGKRGLGISLFTYSADSNETNQLVVLIYYKWNGMFKLIR